MTISNKGNDRFQVVGGNMQSGSFTVTTAVNFATAARTALSVTTGARILWGIVQPTDGDILIGDSASQTFPVAQDATSPSVAGAAFPEDMYIKASTGTVTVTFVIVWDN